MCDFPAETLLRARRQICAQADNSRDPQVIQLAAQFVKGLDDMRLAHEELSGCGCWYSALRSDRLIEQVSNAENIF